MFCKNCGNEVPDNAMFCNKCGADLRRQEQPVQPVAMPPAPAGNSNKNTALIVALVAVAVVAVAAILAVVGILTYKSANSGEAENGAPTSQSQDGGEDAAADPSLTVEPEESQYRPAPVFTTATASDTLVESGYDHSPGLVLDGRGDTAWSVRSGVGDWIMLSAQTEQYVSGIKILNGYQKYSNNSGWLYYQNSRIKSMTLEFSDGSSYDVDLDDLFSDTEYLYQNIDLGTTIKTSYIKITVNDEYSGNRWDDLTVSEIQVY